MERPLTYDCWEWTRWRLGSAAVTKASAAEYLSFVFVLHNYPSSASSLALCSISWILSGSPPQAAEVERLFAKICAVNVCTSTVEKKVHGDLFMVLEVVLSFKQHKIIQKLPRINALLNRSQRLLIQRFLGIVSCRSKSMAWISLKYCWLD